MLLVVVTVATLFILFFASALQHHHVCAYRRLPSSQTGREVQAGALCGAEEAGMGPLQHSVVGAGHPEQHLCSAQGREAEIGKLGDGMNAWRRRTAGCQ